MGQTYQVVLTPGAQRDLLSIFNYLIDNVSSESARRVLNGLEAEIDSLAQMPESKGLLRGTTSSRVYRRALKWSYRIIFTIQEVESRVIVVRIDHGRVDPTTLVDLP